MNTKDYRKRLFKAGRIAVDELLKVIEAEILKGGEDDPEPEKLKIAASAKKASMFDAFDILERIDREEEEMEQAEKIAKGEVVEEKKVEVKKRGFAEERAKKGGGANSSF